MTGEFGTRRGRKGRGGQAGRIMSGELPGLPVQETRPPDQSQIRRSRTYAHVTNASFGPPICPNQLPSLTGSPQTGLPWESKGSETQISAYLHNGAPPVRYGRHWM